MALEKIAKMMLGISLVMTFVSILGCGAFEETPEQAARRAEAERQAGLPLAQASCQELQRRGNRASANLLEGTNVAYFRAVVEQLTARCWIPTLAVAPCDEVQRRADRASANLLEGTNAPFYQTAVLVLRERCW